MKAYQFLVFFSIVLVIYGLVNYYIFTHGAMALTIHSSYRAWFTGIFIFFSSAYIIGRIMEKIWLSPVSTFFTWVGSFWLAIMVYLLFAVLLIDLVRLIMYFFSFSFSSVVADYQGFKMILFSAVVLLVTGLVVGGYINATHPVVTHLNLTVDKKAGERKSLHIAAASDIHMGTLVGPKRTEKLVAMLNNLNADIVLLAGDIVDEDLAPVVRNDLGKSLLKLKAPLGVYGITGNHEYIGGAEAAVKYLEAHGIIMLRDTVLQLDGFYLAGRKDRDGQRFENKKRKTVAELLAGINPTLPLILLDHQPYELQKANDSGVDLQLSGHTHHGQLWPFNYITQAIFEVSKGYKLKGKSHFYVSSGYGGWGPSVRIGNRPEIIDIVIHFK